MAAGAAGSTLSPTGAEAASKTHFLGYPESAGVLHDITRCIGCRKCEAACNTVNELPDPETAFDNLDVLKTTQHLSPYRFTVVNKFDPDGDAENPVYVKTQCNHCLEPACASACFVKALKKQETGAVTYDESLCVGCRYCMIACPFNVPAYEYHKPLTPRVTKCTLCHPRILEGKLPGCVEACPKGALTYGTRTELLKVARERIYRHPDRYMDHIYGEKEMGGTSWLYLAQNPFSGLGMREDLGFVPAPALTSGALAVVPLIVGVGVLFLTGIHAISRRKAQIAEEERQAAVEETRNELEAVMQQKLSEQKKAAEKEKEAAVKREVEKALAEAKEAAGSEESSEASGGKEEEESDE
jgi:Fe-S-cluster-containing dehydrogenase component